MYVTFYEDRGNDKYEKYDFYEGPNVPLPRIGEEYDGMIVTQVEWHGPLSENPSISITLK